MRRRTSRLLIVLAALALPLAFWAVVTRWNSESAELGAPTSSRAVERASTTKSRASIEAPPTEPTTLRSEAPTASNSPSSAGESEPSAAGAFETEGLTARLSIRLFDAETYEPVLGARLALTLGEQTIAAEATGAPGEYAAKELRDGVWTASIEAPGYQPSTRKIGIFEDAFRLRSLLLELLPLGSTLVFARPIDPSVLERPALQGASSLASLLPARYFTAWTASSATDVDTTPIRDRPPERPSEGRAVGGGPAFQALPPRDLDGTGRFAFGWLSLRGAASGWVEFRCADLVLGRVFVDADQAEITVDMDLDAVLARLPSLSMRVVDATDARRPDNARLRLIARAPAKFQANLSSLDIAFRGELELERLEVGVYDLVITAPAMREVRREFTLEFGQALDLGVLALESAAEMRVLVVDPQGRPLLSTLDAAPYDPNASAEDAFARATNQPSVGTGEFEVSAPAGRLLLRARVSPTADAPTANHHSQVVLVDPERSPAELRIVVQEPVLVEVSREEGEVGGRIRVVNEYDVRVVDTDRVALLTYLPPGRYQAFALFGDGGEQSSQTFEVAPNSPPMTIRMP